MTKLNIFDLPHENLALSEIKPYDNNPRMNDDAVPAVAASIKEFGWKQPIVVDKDHVIIAGHTRYKAAKSLGLKEAPCVVATDLTPEQVAAYRLADNKSSERSEWVVEKLLEELNAIKEIDMSEFGFSLDGDEGDEDSYECSRGVRKYRKVIENIYAYDAWRKEHAKRTTLGIQKVVSNADDIKKFYNANANLPVDYISMRPIESTCGSFYKNANNRVDAAACIEAICRLRDFDPRVVFSPKWEMIDEPTAQGCPAHWAQLSLNEKGEVMHCCHKPYQIVGHIMDEDIMQRHKQSFTDVRSCDMPCRLSSANACMETLRVGVKDAYFL